jgi:hypothetical protein
MNALEESEFLESEEQFEKGKVMLSDKKYRDAIKSF